MCKKNLVIFLLTAQLLCGGMLACSQGETEETTPETQATAVETESVETELQPNLPAIDRGGEDFHIFLWSEYQDDFIQEEQTGEPMDDAVYNRNLSIEEKFNLKLQYASQSGNPSGWGTWYGVVEASIMAGDNSIQTAGGYAYRLNATSLNGNFTDLMALENLDFTMPWWAQDLLETSTIGNHIYVAMGYTSPSYAQFAKCIFFNKKLAEDIALPDLYDMVDNREWTFDKLKEYASMASVDLDGDGKMKIGDQFGYITDDYYSVDALMISFDVPLTTYDSDGMPILPVVNERLVSVAEKVHDFFFNSGSVYYGNNQLSDTFKGDLALFYATILKDAAATREMESDFGIIPVPLWDETQADYCVHNVCLDAGTAFVIPISVSEPELSAAVLEEMAYEGHRDMLPLFQEVVLKGKYARDQRSADMIELILHNIRFDFTTFYSYGFGDVNAPTMMLRVAMQKKDPTIASLFAARESQWNETLAQIIDTLAE